MELIAASRIVKAQQRVRRRRALQRADHRGGPGPRSAAGGEVDEPRCSSRRRRSAQSGYVVIAADRGLCGGYNSGVLRAAEGEIKRTTCSARRRLRARRRRPQGRDATSGSAATTSTPSFAGFTEQPTYEDARGDRRRPSSSLYVAGEVDRVELVYTRFVSAGIQEVVLRPLVPLERDGDRRRRRQADRAEGPRAADYEFEPTPGDDPRARCCPATSRPASTPPCSTPRPPSTPSASGP